MKKTALIIISTFAVCHFIGAQVLPVNAMLTAQQQDASTLVNGTYTDKVITMKVTSKDLLGLLEKAYSADFPNGFPFGSTLMLVNYDHFQVQASDGSVLVDDTSQFLYYSDTYSQTNYLFQGKENTLTQARSHTYTYGSYVQFDDPTNNVSFSFTGVTVEKFSKSTSDQFGYRKYQDMMTLTGTGTGGDDSGFFVLSGKLSSPSVRWVDH